VTGGAGFIGSHLVESLLERGARVVALDDFSSGRAGNLSHLRSRAGFEVVEATVCDVHALRSAIADCRFAFHLAAMSSVSEVERHPDRAMEANLIGTLRVLEEAARAGIERLVFAASSSAYGLRHPAPHSETMRAEPSTIYGMTKVAGEDLVRLFAAKGALDTVSLRFFNVYGPRQNGERPDAPAVASFARRLRTALPPVIHGDGGQARDFVFVSDVVRSILMAAVCEQELAGRTINVGSGHGHSIGFVAQQMSRLLGLESLPNDLRPSRPGDCRTSYADTRLARSLLGFEAKVGLAEGLKCTLSAERCTAPRGPARPA
jgi:UDP-glucose 4-epimerase